MWKTLESSHKNIMQKLVCKYVCDKSIGPKAVIGEGTPAHNLMHHSSKKEPRKHGLRQKLFSIAFYAANFLADNEL